MTTMTRRTAILSATAAMFLGAPAFAQEAKPAPSADAVMAQALRKAKDTKRVVFTHFGASW